MKIEICTQSYSWFKRQWWQLSSIHNQLQPDKHEIVYAMNLFAADPYYDMAIDMAKLFSQPGLEIKLKMWNDEQIYGYRGNIRNSDWSRVDNDTDWLIYLDPDIVLSHDWLDRWARWVEKDDHRGRVISLQRHMVPREIADAAVAAEQYDRPITDIERKLGVEHVRGRGSTVGAGYFQALHWPTAREQNVSSYCESHYDYFMFDTAKNKGRMYRTFSEKAIRKLLGVKRVHRLGAIYHMEHVRREDPDWLQRGCL